MPRVLKYLKALMTSPSDGRGGDVSGGVFDHGTYEEDGPGTWEILCLSTDSFDGPLLVSFFHPLKSIRSIYSSL